MDQKCASCDALCSNEFQLRKNPSHLARGGYRRSSPRSRCISTGSSPLSNLSHLVSLPQLAKSAWQLGSCQPFFNSWLSKRAWAMMRQDGGTPVQCADLACSLARVQQSPTSLLLPQFGPLSLLNIFPQPPACTIGTHLHLFHDKILLNGLIAGGTGRKEGRQTCYFSAAHPQKSKAVLDQKNRNPQIVPYVHHMWQHRHDK